MTAEPLVPQSTTPEPPGSLAPKRFGRDRLLLGLIAAAYLVVAAVVGYQHTMPLMTETDGVNYMLRAEGPFFTIDPFHGPGYPMAIKAAKLLGMGTFAAAKLASVVFGLVLLLVLHRLVATFSNAAQALTASALTVFSPLFLLMSTAIMSDVMGAALALCAIALFVVPARLTLWHVIAAGICVCAAYLTRYAYAFLLALPLLVWMLRARRWKLRDGLIAIVVFLAAFELFGLPWFMYLKMEKGSPFWNLNHLNVAFKIFYDAASWRDFPSETDYAGWWDLFTISPSLFATSWWQTARELPAHLQELLPGSGLLGIAGAVVWCVAMTRRKAVFLIASALFFVLVSLVWLKGRFFLFLLPITATFVAAGFALLPAQVPGVDESRRFGRRIARIPLRAVAVVLFLIILGVNSNRTIETTRANAPVEYREAGEWIRAHSNGEVSVMAAKPHVAFYAGARHIDFWENGVARMRAVDFAELLLRIEPDYLVFDVRYAYHQFPRLQHLKGELHEPFSGLLNLVYTAGDQRVYVYEYIGGE